MVVSTCKLVEWLAVAVVPPSVRMRQYSKNSFLSFPRYMISKAHRSDSASFSAVHLHHKPARAGPGS